MYALYIIIFSYRSRRYESNKWDNSRDEGGDVESETTVELAPIGILSSYVAVCYLPHLFNVTFQATQGKL